MTNKDLGNDWLLRCQTTGVLPGWPRLLAVAVETRATPAYHLRGRIRQDENHWVFQYSLAGEGFFRNASGVRRLGAGRGFLCETGDPRVAYGYPRAGRQPWRFLYICFRGEAAAAMARALLARYGPIYRVAGNEPIIRRFLEWGEQVRETGRGGLDGAICEQGFTGFSGITRRSAGQAESAGWVVQLLAALARAHETEDARDAGALLAQRAIALVDQDAGIALNVSQLAARLQVSREHLARILREQIGQAPHALLQRRRMLAACALIKANHYSMKEISRRVGFNSAAHFCRVFRKTLDLTPRQFQLSGRMPML